MGRWRGVERERKIGGERHRAGLTLVVSCSVVADVLDTLRQSIDKLLVEQSDSSDRIVVSVDTNDIGVLSTLLGLLKERGSVRDV